ncbi:MAG: hypothetical protein KIS61_30695 [Candidatus Eremiobacteraeota bacterium]|nr:hypothetical protein [Candidatus Eremiobacteraeota bacterium]
MKSALLILLLTLTACAQPNDDEFWAQRILSAAQVVSARLDHAGRHTALCIRKSRSSIPPLYTTFPYDLQFIVPEGAPQTSRVRAARAQAAGTITSAWLRYTGEVNAACIEANQELKFPKIDTQKMYFQILGN